MTSATKMILPQNLDFFLVLDFEATCERNTRIEPQEIIEFPVLKVNGKTFEVESKFHHYVQPKVHRQLTKFCTELTGITQDMVDGQPNLEETLKAFDDWMVAEGIVQPGVKSIFVTCGDWDLQKMLVKEAGRLGLDYKDYLKWWINIKKTFESVIGVYPKGDLIQMLQVLDLPLIGRHHSGIDDCVNIARILKSLAERECVFEANGKL